MKILTLRHSSFSCSWKIFPVLLASLIISWMPGFGKSSTQTPMSPPALLSVEDGQNVFNTTLLISPVKANWWVKSASIKDAESSRVCQEDKSPRNRISQALLSEIHITPPNLKGEIGLFNVQFVPTKNFSKIKNFSTCTYHATLTYRQGSKSYSAQNIFVLKLQPGPDISDAGPGPDRMKIEKENQAKADADTRAKLALEQKARAEAEAKQNADLAEKQRILAEEKKAKAVAEQKETEKLQAEAEAKKAAEEKALAEAGAKKAAEEKALAEAEAKKAAEEKALAEAEAKKAADEKALAEANNIPAPQIFQPEDMEGGDSTLISPEAQEAFDLAAVAALPKNRPNQATASFADGMMAYKTGNYSKAIEIFNSLPEPTSRKRGDKSRDEYVNANFYKGLALQKSGKLEEAVQAYQSVINYEKYFPVLSMNLGICYLEMKKFAQAHRAFKDVIRDQSRIPPERFDDIMQNTRFFWALAWTRLHKLSTDPDKKRFFSTTAKLKWNEYLSWYGDNPKFSDKKLKAEHYLSTL